VSPEEELLKAVDASDVGAVLHWLENGAEPNARLSNVFSPRHGWGALHLAVVSGKLEILALLLGHGADVNALLTYKAGMERTVVDATQSALLLAVRAKQEQVVELLLERGANLHLRDSYDRSTALIEASRLGLASVVTMLLEHGANPADIDAMTQSSVVELAEAAGHGEVARLLREALREDRVTP
jgi:ankyrin repeat protein